MSMPSSTQSVLAAQAFFANYIRLEEEKFCDSLTDDVTMVHVRMEGGLEGERSTLNGKEAVAAFCHKHFFSITSNLDVAKVKHQGFLTARINLYKSINICTNE